MTEHKEAIHAIKKVFWRLAIPRIATNFTCICPVNLAPKWNVSLAPGSLSVAFNSEVYKRTSQWHVDEAVSEAWVRTASGLTDAQ